MYFHFLAAVHFMSKLIYYVLDFLHIQIWAAQRWGSEVMICLLLSAAVGDFTKYIMTSIPFLLLSCLPVTSHIAECPVAAIPPEPSWFPTTVLHLPWLQCKATVKLEIPIRARFPTKMRRKIYIYHSLPRLQSQLLSIGLTVLPVLYMSLIWSESWIRWWKSLLSN